MNPDRETTFRFRRFSVRNTLSAMKVGTDGVLLGAWAAVDDSTRMIADIGTGTGLIALMMAQRAPEARITGIEIDPEAAREAALNVAESEWGDRIEIVSADIRNVASEITGMDLIVSNPPFFKTGLLSPDGRRAAARHGEGLTPVALVEMASGMLRPQGRLAMIVPVDSFEDVEWQAALSRMSIARITQVVTVEGKQPKRLMLELVKGDASTVTDTLCIKTRSGELSEEYRRLTSEFYL